MENKEEIEKAKGRIEDILNCYDEYKKDYEEGHQSSFELDLEDFEVLKTLLQYIDQLEKSDASKEQSSMNYYNKFREQKQENEELKKGIASLMASRKKWKDRAYKLRKKSNKLNKMIDKMAEYLAIIRDCPNEDKGANLDCENRCSNDDSLYAKCWKQYFEKKVEEK